LTPAFSRSQTQFGNDNPLETPFPVCTLLPRHSLSPLVLLSRGLVVLRSCFCRPVVPLSSGTCCLVLALPKYPSPVIVFSHSIALCETHPLIVPTTTGGSLPFSSIPCPLLHALSCETQACRFFLRSPLFLLRSSFFTLPCCLVVSWSCCRFSPLLFAPRPLLYRTGGSPYSNQIIRNYSAKTDGEIPSNPR